MRIRIVQACSLFCSSPFTTKSAFGAPVSGASTRTFSIFASPSVRRPLTLAAIWATRGSLFASAIGITVTVAGPRGKIRPGRNIHTATAVPRMASPAAEANAMRRRLKSNNRFAGPLLVSTVAVVSGRGRPGPADGGYFRRRRDGDLGHVGLEQIAAAGDHPDDLALVVAERGADFADALEQA